MYGGSTMHRMQVVDHLFPAVCSKYHAQSTFEGCFKYAIRDVRDFSTYINAGTSHLGIFQL